MDQAEADSLLQQLADLSPQPDRLLLGLLVPREDLRDHPPLRDGGGDCSHLDPAEEVSLPQLERHGRHAGPDDGLVGEVEAVEMLGEDLHLVDEGPETDRVLSHPNLLSLLLRVAEEGAEVARLTVVRQGYQQLLCELETARELAVDLNTIIYSIR